MLYGNSAFIAELISRSESVVLVTGDSGVGKSALLDAAGADLMAQGHIVANRATLKSRPGALQKAFLSSLTDIVEQLSGTEQLLKRTAERLLSAAKSMAADHLKELGAALAKEVFSMIKARMGPEAGDALAEYVQSVKQTDSNTLQQRIATMADEDVLQSIMTLLKEVAKIAHDRSLILLLDDAQRLTGPDFAQLLDLADELPEGILVRIGFTSSIPAERKCILNLTGRGFAEYQLQGIDEFSVRQWLAGSGIDTSLGSRVHRLSAGYPMTVADIVTHLKAGKNLDELAAHSAVASITETTLDQLELEVASAARRLSPFFDPPSRDDIPDYLLMSTSQWSEIEERLCRSRIFSVVVNGQRWFHDQRRRCLWDSLSETDQDMFSTNAFKFLRGQLEINWSNETVVSLAEIALSNPGVTRSEVRSQAVLAASAPEVGLAGALLEIAEPARQNDPSATEVALLFAYARRVFSASGDLLSSLEALRNRDLVFTTSNDYATVVIPRFDFSAVALLAGRAGILYGRVPVIGLASEVFDVALRPRIQPFIDAAIGVGYPSISEMFYSHRKMQRDRNSTPNHIVVPDQNEPALVCRAKYGEIDLNFSISFMEQSHLDQAKDRIINLSKPIYSQPFRMTQVLKFPSDRIRARRWVNALEWITGRRIRTISGLDISLPGEPGISDFQRIRRRLEIYRVIRAYSSLDEQRAYDLERKVRLAYYSDAETLVSISIHSDQDGLIRLDELPPGLHRGDSMWAFHLERRLDLAPEENIFSVTSSGRAMADQIDPVAEIINDVVKNARHYNGFQPRFEVELDQDRLLSELKKCVDVTLADARLLNSVAPVSGGARPMPRLLQIVLDPVVPEPGWRVGFRSIAGYRWYELQDEDENMIQLVLLDPVKALGGGRVQEVMNELRRPASGRTGGTWIGPLDSLLAELLGYEDDSIRLVFP